MKVKRRGTDGPIYDALPGYSLPDCYEVVNESPNEPKVEERMTHKFNPDDRVSWRAYDGSRPHGTILSAHGPEDKRFYRIQRHGGIDPLCVFESDLRLEGDPVPSRDYGAVSDEELSQQISIFEECSANGPGFQRTLAICLELRERRQREKARRSEPEKDLAMIEGNLDEPHFGANAMQDLEKQMPEVKEVTFIRIKPGPARYVYGVELDEAKERPSYNPFDPTAKKTARDDLP